MWRASSVRGVAIAACLAGAVGAAPPEQSEAGAAEDAGLEAAASTSPSGSAAPAPSAAAPGAPSPSPDAAPPTASTAAAPAKRADDAGPLDDSPTLHSAFVHLFADYPGAVLELRSYIDETDWKVACQAPCDRTLRVDGMDARVVAPGMTTSNVFRIEPGRGTANLKVDGGSAGSRTIGTVGFAAGIPLALGGMALWGYGKLEDRRGLQTAGIVTLGVAAVALVGALPFLSAGSTKVRDGKGKTIASRSAPPLL